MVYYTMFTILHVRVAIAATYVVDENTRTVSIIK